MRNIVNISVPAEMAKDIKRGVKAGKFASTSEFMRHLIRVWNMEKTGGGLKSLHPQSGVLPLGKGELRKGNYTVLKSL